MTSKVTSYSSEKFTGFLFQVAAQIDELKDFEQKIVRSLMEQRVKEHRSFTANQCSFIGNLFAKYVLTEKPQKEPQKKPELTQEQIALIPEHLRKALSL